MKGLAFLSIIFFLLLTIFESGINRKKAPLFELEAIDGKLINLDKLKGKIKKDIEKDLKAKKANSFF